jgi:hypothetical protein
VIVVDQEHEVSDKGSVGDLVRRMARLGRDADIDVDSVSEALPELAARNGLRVVQALRPRIAALSPSELASCLRVIVLVERIHGWTASVSASIALFQTLARRDPRVANEVAGWIVDNRAEGSYAPWGTLFTGGNARSIGEFTDAQARAQAQREAILEADRARRQRRTEAAAERQSRRTERAAELRPERQARIAAAMSASDEMCLETVLASRLTLDYWPPPICGEVRIGHCAGRSRQACATLGHGSDQLSSGMEGSTNSHLAAAARATGLELMSFDVSAEG